jgi:hypothetical protein
MDYYSEAEKRRARELESYTNLTQQPTREEILERLYPREYLPQFKRRTREPKKRNRLPTIMEELPPIELYEPMQLSEKRTKKKTRLPRPTIMEELPPIELYEPIIERRTKKKIPLPRPIRMKSALPPEEYVPSKVLRDKSYKVPIIYPELVPRITRSPRTTINPKRKGVRKCNKWEDNVVVVRKRVCRGYKKGKVTSQGNRWIDFVKMKAMENYGNIRQGYALALRDPAVSYEYRQIYGKAK